MMYGWWDGSSGPWYGMIFAPILMIVFIVMLVLIIAWSLHAFGFGWRSESEVVSIPLDTLKQRFARGEIDRAEYEERKKLLSE